MPNSSKLVHLAPSEQEDSVPSDRYDPRLGEASRLIDADKCTPAFSLLRDVLTRHPSHAQGRRLFAKVLLRLGNLKAATHAYESLVVEARDREDFGLTESPS